MLYPAELRVHAFTIAGWALKATPQLAAQAIFPGLFKGVASNFATFL